MQNKTVLVAYGGVSPEHEVSVLTAMQALSALEGSGYDTLPLYISKSGAWYTGDLLRDLENYQDLKKLEQKALPCSFEHSELGATRLVARRKSLFQKKIARTPDVVLVAFHGSSGENGAFQGLCEAYNLPYTGCDVFSSALGMDKVRSKLICRTAGIPVVEDTSFTESDWTTKQDRILDSVETIGYPAIVKPVHLGSSIGVSLATNREELKQSVERAFRYDETLLVERAIQPLTEVNCSVLGDKSECEASVCERPAGKEELLSFHDKYMSGEGDNKGMASAARKIPADIPDELATQIQETAKTIFTLFGASGVARLDFLLNRENGSFYFNEINTIPGSFSFYLWEESEVPFQQLLIRLIQLALQRHERENRRIRSYETNLLSQKAAKGIKGLKGGKG